MKRTISVLLTITMILSVIAVAPFTVSALTQSEFNSRVATQKAKYPNGSVCYSTQFGQSCFGWAYLIGYNIFETSPASWSKIYSLSSVQAGDIIQYGNTSGSGHTVFVVSVSGNTITFADCNGNGNRNSAGQYVAGLCMVKWDNTTTISANALFGYKFSYLLRSNYNVIHTPTDKPDKPSLTSNKSIYPYGETVTLSWGNIANATNYWLDFYKDGNKVDGRLVSNPLVLKDLEPGKYSAYITAINAIGQTTSNVCNFEVFNSVPNKPQLTSNKSVCPYGDDLTLSWNATMYATNYWLDFYKDGVKVDGRSVSSPLVLTDLEPGEYAAYVTATNPFGQTTSNVCNFEVFNSAPGKPYINLNKSEYLYGEDITLIWENPKYTNNYWLDFYKDGVKVDGRSVSSPLILKDLEPGEYAVYITANNLFGHTTSDVCNFQVKDDESELSLYGDANGDGEVNIQDATLVQMYVAKYKVDNFNEKLADYDQSGGVNIQDATAIQMKVAKLA